MALGIEQLKKAAKLLVSFGEKIEATTKDGFQVTDLFQFLGELSQIPDIIMNKDNIVAEFKDLDAQERAELVAYIEAELTLENRKTEQIIEAALYTVIALLGLVEKIREPKEPPVTEEPVQ